MAVLEGTTVPERIEAAVNRLRAAVDDLRDAMHARTEHFTRILIGIGVLCLTELAVLCIVLSAVMPGWPVLRIYEHNREQTARVVQELNQQHQDIINRLNKLEGQ